jgi:hypothetical protein
MRNEYENNPNICYAIGDMVGEFLGAGTENHQPSSGVEEQITAIVKAAANDNWAIFDGSNESRIIISSGRTDTENDTADSMADLYTNTAMMINNALYVKKAGSTDIIAFTGVQTNA